MDNKEKILQVAEKFFWQHGFRGTSIRQIAKEAGVNIAMISYYFGSKVQLLQQIIEVQTGALSSKIDKVKKDETKTPEEKLELTVDFYIERIYSNMKAAAIFHREIASIKEHNKIGKTKIAKNILNNVTNIKSIILEGQEKSVFRKDIDVELTVLTIISSITQILNSRFFTKNLLNIDAFNMTEKDKIALRHRLKNHISTLIDSHLKIRKNYL